MKKIIVFGNSGAGKSTLAKKISTENNIAHLDLDTLAFRADVPTERRCIEESLKDVNTFIKQSESWVIEGGYSDIFELILEQANDMIYLDLPAASCLDNARNRAWEPHKYESKEAQDKNLKMLLNWIQDYYSRDDAFSKASHDVLYNQFSGNKTRIRSNQ